MFKFGIVGAGIIGRSHADILMKNPDCTLVAVCDTVIERTEEIAKEHNAASFTDYKEMDEKTELDAVNLNLPHFLHGEKSGVVTSAYGREVIRVLESVFNEEK